MTPAKSALAIMKRLIKEVQIKVARVDAGEDCARERELPTRTILAKQDVTAYALATECDAKQRLDDMGIMRYDLDANELHLLEMAERRAVRIDDLTGVEIVWNWIADRTKININSVRMIPGTQSFYAVPVNQNKEMNNETLSAFVGRGVDACVA